MIGGLQGEFGNLDNKYLKQNIPKYRSKMSGRFRRTPLHYTERKTLQVSVIRRSGYVYPEKSKRPPLPSGYRIFGCKMLAHGTSSFPIRMWDIRMKNVGAQNSWKSHPADSISYLNMLSGCPSMVYPDALRWYIRTPCPGILLVWIPKNSPQSQICFGDQKAIKTPKLNTIWLELIAMVLTMLIGLKGDNYYSKLFKRVNYWLSNNTFWVVIMSTSTTERERFHYTIESIIEDRTKYNYWVPETSHVSPLLVSIPYYKVSLSTEYLPFFLTSLSTSYSLYRSISISWLFPFHDLEYL